MHPRLLLSLKLMIALAMVGAILTFGAHQFFPRVPLHRLALLSLAGWAGAMGVICLLVLAKVGFNQFILQRAGTDAQWLTVGREPPGLKRLRRGQRRGQFTRRWSD